MSWETVKLGDIAEFSNGINFDKSAYSKGVKLIGVSNFGNRFSPDYDSLEEIKEEAVRPNDYLQNGDIVFVRSNGNKELVGRCMLIKNPESPVTYSGFCIRTRLKDITKYNPVFFTYLFKSSGFRKSVIGTAVGANIQNLSQGRLSSCEIRIPDFKTQNRIADILSAYDDLIENNQKQIKLLEEAAQRLYKEWFVDLRFPGHENTPIIDGVPQGWKRKTVEECLAFHSNGGWGKEELTGKNTNAGKVIRGTDIEDVKNGRFESIPTRYHSDKDIRSKILQEYDLIFELSNGNINNIGRCLFVDDLILKKCGKNTICASFCKILRPIDIVHSLLLYWEIQDMQTDGRMLPLKKHGANGINNFDFDGFLNHTLLVPDDATMLAPIESIMRKIIIIQRRFTLLIEVRDRLLPKLMSCELEV